MLFLRRESASTILVEFKLGSELRSLLCYNLIKEVCNNVNLREQQSTSK
jgi:hypothetical protein